MARLRARSDLCELMCSSRWPPWRRCFGVQQDGRDALLIALKFIGVCWTYVCCRSGDVPPGDPVWSLGKLGYQIPGIWHALWREELA